jgi:hypothetical protein
MNGSLFSNKEKNEEVRRENEKERKKKVIKMEKKREAGEITHRRRGHFQQRQRS